MSMDLQLLGWRRAVAELYAAVRAEEEPESAHARWREGRDRLFASHPESPLPPGDPRRRTGLSFWPYDRSLRFELPLLAPEEPTQLSLDAGEDGSATLRLAGMLELPPPLGARVALWSLSQYAGGLFLPLRDGTAGRTSYGGGRYLLDTAKGADLGGSGSTLVVDLNFLYHPSCCYSSRWTCPLAPPANTLVAPVEAGERL